jgi:hypothetical protein
LGLRGFFGGLNVKTVSSMSPPDMDSAHLSVGFFLCAEHAQQLGGESPLPNLMVVKG